jgi:hypothetical protein
LGTTYFANWFETTVATLLQRVDRLPIGIPGEAPLGKVVSPL